MPITKEKKTAILGKLKEVFDNSNTMVFVNFHGLTVGEMMILRRDLKASQVNYLVSKKSLVKKVLKDSKTKGEIPELPGELSLAWGADLLEPARKIFTNERKLKDKISILGGIFQGSYMNKAQMIEIAQIPPRETLLAQFVNIINSPIQGLVVGLSKIAEKKV